MRDQVLQSPFVADIEHRFTRRAPPYIARIIFFGLPFVFSIVIAGILILAFRGDGQLSRVESALIALIALLGCWEAMPTATAIIGIFAQNKPFTTKSQHPMSVAILVTIRDEDAQTVLSKKIDLVGALQGQSLHRFSLHILSDSRNTIHVEDERRIVRAASHLPVTYHHRAVNIDFKSGNIRNWIENNGAAFDAFVTLDADSEITFETVEKLANFLSSDPGCALIQTIPRVLPGHTHWQRMQSVASRLYGGLQGQGHSLWMGDESNYYGHNAIIRTKAFASSAGLPRLRGYGLWNGTILSHDFVEAALLRRAGWAVRLLPTESGSYEQAPSDVLAHLKRDARWCLGNFQHSRILRTTGLHFISRFHLISGIASYFSSALWLITLLLWAVVDTTQTVVVSVLATAAMTLIFFNLLLPRILGVIRTTMDQPSIRWTVTKEALVETLFMSLVAPSLMVQRVIIMGSVLTNRKISWPSYETGGREFPDYLVFHVVEVLLGLGLLACVERGYLTFWFLPLALCLAGAPVLSWWAARPIHTKI